MSSLIIFVIKHCLVDIFVLQFVLKGMSSLSTLEYIIVVVDSKSTWLMLLAYLFGATNTNDVFIQ